ncbi:APC family permease [Phaeodactylibacter luteus]|uniref:APC family permease n=1 Tax=Phaeodactylibacter luteus TaxID=1564516 RepID=A0A5C6S738_9BACT|nr:APC family permease [Phaeodactylibacter luteus]
MSLKPVPSKIGWLSAAALVVANMIGTGVFTSLGFQVVDIKHTWSLLLLWGIGGLVALTGAFSYAELGALYKRSGGEYDFLTRLYHPLAGYLSGWISLTVGFAAPVGLAAMAMGTYLEPATGLSGQWVAIGAVVATALMHSWDLRQSSRFQDILTLLKALLILGIIVLGLALPPAGEYLDFSEGWGIELAMPAYAVALIFVTYSYTGWNAAAYIVEEIRQPAINLPKALVRGTLAVTVLYVLLQLVFLRHTPLHLLEGQVDVGHIYAVQLLGEGGGRAVSLLIAFFLLSSISAMAWVGPRVSLSMARDYPFWHFLRQQNRQGIPVRAVWFQAGISLVLILTGTFEQVLVYCGFILQLSSALTVLGSFRIRQRQQELPYRSPFHPLFPLLFTAISLWILAYALVNNPQESLLGLGNLLLGYLTWHWGRRLR